MRYKKDLDTFRKYGSKLQELKLDLCKFIDQCCYDFKDKEVKNLRLARQYIDRQLSIFCDNYFMQFGEKFNLDETNNVYSALAFNTPDEYVKQAKILQNIQDIVLSLQFDIDNPLGKTKTKLLHELEYVITGIKFTFEDKYLQKYPNNELLWGHLV